MKTVFNEKTLRHLRPKMTLALTLASFLLCHSAQAGFVSTTFEGTVGSDPDNRGGLEYNGTLVGTSFNPANDTQEAVNAVIGGKKDGTSTDGIDHTDGYNREFGSLGTGEVSDLPLAPPQLDKFQEDSSGNKGFENGVFSASDFNFYELDSSGSKTWNGATFAQITSLSDTLTQTVMGIEYVGTPGLDAGIEYLASKGASTNAGGGFSVWKYQPGQFNTFYVDDDGDQTFDGSGNYVFDGRGGHAVSHFSFYGTTVTTPEPSSLSLLALGGLGLLGYRTRRRKKELTQ